MSSVRVRKTWKTWGQKAEEVVFLRKLHKLTRKVSRILPENGGLCHFGKLCERLSD